MPCVLCPRHTGFQPHLKNNDILVHTPRTSYMPVRGRVGCLGHAVAQPYSPTTLSPYSSI